MLGLHALDAEPLLNWPHTTTSRMSWLSDTRPLTEHIKCSICCSGALHEESWPADPTILQHTPALRVSSTRHWRPSLPSATTTTRYFLSSLGVKLHAVFQMSCITLDCWHGDSKLPTPHLASPNL